MKARMSALVLVAAAAACASPTPPPGSAPGDAVVDADVPPIAALLGEREQLALTSAQVSMLDSIARAWAAADYDIRRERGALRRNHPFAITAVLRPDAGSLRGAVAANNSRAMHAVEQILTPEQRQRTCDAASTARTRPTSRPAGTRGNGLFAFGAGTSDAGPEARRSWPWCAESAPAPALATTQRGS